MLDTVCVHADGTCERILEYSEIARGFSGQFSGNISISGNTVSTVSGSYNDGTLTINVNGVSGDINFPDSLTESYVVVQSPESVSSLGNSPIGYLVYDRGYNMDSVGTSMSDSVTVPCIDVYDSRTYESDVTHIMSGMDWVEVIGSQIYGRGYIALLPGYIVTGTATSADVVSADCLFENTTLSMNYYYTVSAGSYSMDFSTNSHFKFIMDVEIEGYLMYRFSNATTLSQRYVTYCALNESGEPSKIRIRITQGSTTLTWTNTERLYIYHPTTISSTYFAQLILAPIYE